MGVAQGTGSAGRLLLQVSLLASLVPGVAGCTEEEGPDYRELGAVTFKAMTFNVLCSFCSIEEYDPWDDRVGYFADIIERHDPDIVGFQEFFVPDEVLQVGDLCPGYDFFFFQDDDGPFVDDYPDAFLFYKRDVFEFVESGFYWLSATPDEAWSTGWAEAQVWRLVAWARLRHREDGGDLYLATTHFDNNHPNQEMSAGLLLERTAPWAEHVPVVVLGDFNSRPGSEAYATLTEGTEGAGFALRDSFELAESWSVDHNQAAEPTYETGDRIDHIFVGGPAEWSCPSWVADLHVYGDLERYPSDHFAIIATLSTQ